MSYRAYSVNYRAYHSPYRNFKQTATDNLQLPAVIGPVRATFGYEPLPEPPEEPPPVVP